MIVYGDAAAVVHYRFIVTAFITEITVCNRGIVVKIFFELMIGGQIAVRIDFLHNDIVTIYRAGFV